MSANKPEHEGRIQLRNEVLQLMNRWHPETVADLIAMLNEKRGIRTTESDLADILRDLKFEGKLQIEIASRHHKRLIPFLKDLELTKDFWTVLIGIVVLDAIILFPDSVLLAPLRWSLGILAILLFPGYSIQMCLFPGKGELVLWKRILLGVGLSIAVMGFYAIILDATATGIVIGSVLIIFTFHSLIFSWIGLLRRFEAQQARG